MGKGRGKSFSNKIFNLDKQEVALGKQNARKPKGQAGIQVFFYPWDSDNCPKTRDLRVLFSICQN